MSAAIFNIVNLIYIEGSWIAVAEVTVETDIGIKTAWVVTNKGRIVRLDKTLGHVLAPGLITSESFSVQALALKFANSLIEVWTNI